MKKGQKIEAFIESLEHWIDARSMLRRIFHLLQRTEVLRSTRRAGAPLAEGSGSGSSVFQGAHPVGRGLCAFAKAIPASGTFYGRASTTPGLAPVQARPDKSGALFACFSGSRRALGSRTLRKKYACAGGCGLPEEPLEPDCRADTCLASPWDAGR